MNSHLDWFSVTYVLWRHHVKHFCFFILYETNKFHVAEGLFSYR